MRTVPAPTSEAALHAWVFVIRGRRIVSFGQRALGNAKTMIKTKPETICLRFLALLCILCFDLREAMWGQGAQPLGRVIGAAVPNVPLTGSARISRNRTGAVGDAFGSAYRERAFRRYSLHNSMKNRDTQRVSLFYYIRDTLGCRPNPLGDFIPKPLLRFARF